MKKFTLLIGILLATNFATGQINAFDTTFYSPALDDTIDVRVYLPPGYDDHPDWYYPVIYYLHPWRNGPFSMTGFANLAEDYINDGTIDPVIILCADNYTGPFDGTY